MTISKRLTRAGAAFMIFGTCAAMLPGTSGSFMTASDACSSSSSNTGAYVAGGAALLLAAILLDPGAFGLGGVSSAGATGAAYDPASGLFSYIYGPAGSPAE